MLQKTKSSQASFMAMARILNRKNTTVDILKQKLEEFVQQHGKESLKQRYTFFAKIHMYNQTILRVECAGNILDMIVLCTQNREFLKCLLPYRAFIGVEEPITEIVKNGGIRKLPYENLTAFQWLLLGNLPAMEQILCIEFFVLFLKANPNTTIPLDKGRSESLLHFVIKLNIDEQIMCKTVSMLLNHKADANKSVDYFLNEISPNSTVNLSFTPLLLAMQKKKSYEVINLLIESGVVDLCGQEFTPGVYYPIAEKNKVKWNYLMWAIYFNRCDVLEGMLNYLIKFPGQAEKFLHYSSSHHHCTPIRSAIDCENVKAVEILHKYCQKLNIPTIQLKEKAGIIILLEVISKKEKICKALEMDIGATSATHHLIANVKTFLANGSSLLIIKKILQQGGNPLEYEIVDNKAVDTLSALANFIGSSACENCDITHDHLSFFRFIHATTSKDNTESTNAIIEALKLFKKLPKHFHQKLVELSECLLEHCKDLSHDAFFMESGNIIGLNLPPKVLILILIRLKPTHVITFLLQLARQDFILFAKLFDPIIGSFEARFLTILIKPDGLDANQPSLLVEMIKSSSNESIQLLLNICRIKKINIEGEYAVRILYSDDISAILRQHIDDETKWNNVHNDLFLIAASFGYSRLHILLQEKVVNVNNDNYVQALIIAVCNNDVELLRFLIRKKKSVALKINPRLNARGFRLLDLANLLENKQIAETLKQELLKNEELQAIAKQKLSGNCVTEFDIDTFAPVTSYAYLIEQNISPSQIREWRQRPICESSSGSETNCDGQLYTWGNGRLSSADEDIKEVEGNHGFRLFVNMKIDHLVDRQNLPSELKEQFKKVRPKMHIGIRPLTDKARANVSLILADKTITTVLAYELEISAEKRLFGVLIAGDNNIQLLYWVFYGDALHNLAAIDSLVQRAKSTQYNPMQIPDLSSEYTSGANSCGLL